MAWTRASNSSWSNFTRGSHDTSTSTDGAVPLGAAIGTCLHHSLARWIECSATELSWGPRLIPRASVTRACEQLSRVLSWACAHADPRQVAHERSACAMNNELQSASYVVQRAADNKEIVDGPEWWHRCWPVPVPGAGACCSYGSAGSGGGGGTAAAAVANAALSLLPSCADF